jgi:hypothetical protein
MGPTKTGGFETGGFELRRLGEPVCAELLREIAAAAGLDFPGGTLTLELLKDGLRGLALAHNKAQEELSAAWECMRGQEKLIAPKADERLSSVEEDLGQVVRFLHYQLGFEPGKPVA